MHASHHYRRRLIQGGTAEEPGGTERPRRPHGHCRRCDMTKPVLTAPTPCPARRVAA